MEMSPLSQHNQDAPFERKDIAILQQQIRDLQDELAERVEKYETKINFERNQGDATASALVHGVETTPELIASLQQRLQLMKETETVLVQEAHRETVGKVKGFVRQAAVVAGITLGSFVANEGVERKNTTTKTKEVPNTEISIKPESL